MLAGGGAAPTPTVDIDAIARDVIAGKYGNGVGAQAPPGFQLRRRAAQSERAALVTREDLAWGVGVGLAAALLVVMLPLLPAIWLLGKIDL